MKRFIKLFMAGILLFSNITPISAAESIVAFPGAEGGGKFATGGRGGKVVYVTNLNDSGEGSFRDAVSGSNRIVVFKVGGTIELKSDVVVKSNVTIAGQTAPGGAGVTLKNYKVGLGGSNIIMRFISSRPGERGTNADYDALGGSDGTNSIIDHCSFGWANDEQWGLYSNNDNATTQWSIIGPSNSFSYHSKGIHGFAIMFGRSNQTWHHNMIAHNVSRNFRGKVPGTNAAEFVNNVIYDWGYQTAYGTLGHLNYVGNYLKMGPSTAGGKHYIAVGNSGTAPENYKIYLTGNKMTDKDGKDYSTLTANNWTGITYGAGKTEADTKANTPFAIKSNGVDVSVAKTAESADDAFNNVIAYAGAGINAESRPAIDSQVMEEARTGTGYITGARPKSEANATQLAEIEKYNIQCGTKYEYPAKNTNAPVDSDGDGMPDEWEIERGLNPNSKYAADGTLESNGDYCGQGYTNIEYYINDLTVDAFPQGVVTVSPTINKELAVGTNEEFKTISSALAYAKENNTGMGTISIKVADGIYNESLTIDMPVNITANKAMVNDIAITANDVTLDGIGADKLILTGGDRLVVKNSGFSDVESYGRMYLKDSSVSTIKNSANVIADNATIQNTTSDADILFMNSTVETVRTNGSAKAVASNSVVGNASNNLILCNCTDIDGNAIADTITQVQFLEEYPPFSFSKSNGTVTDNWNPGNWDEVTPQQKLSALADSVTVAKAINNDTVLTTKFDSDNDVVVQWQCDVENRLENNTVKIGEYGDGAVTVHLTATVKKQGLKDEVRTFETLVGSKTQDGSLTVTFDDEQVGAKPAYFADSSTAAGVSGEVTDNINGTKFADNGNFYMVKQNNPNAADTEAIHNFTYNFGANGEKVIEVGYDVYMGNMTDASFFEAYVRGTNTLSQVRFSNLDGSNSIEAYADAKTRTELNGVTGSGWYKIKTVIDTVGVTTGTAPKIDYYLYDNSGKQLAKMLNSAPAKDYTADTASAFIPDRIVFRPNRKLPVCEFYVDNIYVKNLTDEAENDAKLLSANAVLEMSDNAGLPSVGAHMSDVKWRVVDGFEGLVNSDGTINYSQCKNTSVKVKGTVTIGSNLKASAETDTITLNITGTGATNPQVDDKTFTDTDSFNGWIPQLNYADVVSLNDTENIGGNATSKIRLNNKAVFKPLSGAIGTGKYTFTTDIYSNASNADDRSFRIYLENAATANSGGNATAEFAATNIFYHLMNIGGKATVITADDPSAKVMGGSELGAVANNKWYNIKIDLDFDNGTAKTELSVHNNGYSPDDITKVGETETTFIAKTPVQLSQIRLVRTAESTVYFDNISLKEEKPIEPENILYGDADNNGSLTSSDSAMILQKVLNRSFVMGIEVNEDYIKWVDVDADGKLTAADSSIVLQKVLNNSYQMTVEKK